MVSGQNGSQWDYYQFLSCFSMLLISTLDFYFKIPLVFVHESSIIIITWQKDIRK